MHALCVVRRLYGAAASATIPAKVQPPTTTTEQQTTGVSLETDLRKLSKESLCQYASQNPGSAAAWSALARSLGPGDTACCGSTTMTKLQCALEAVNVTPANERGDVSLALGCAMVREQVPQVTLRDGTVLTAQQCFVMSAQRRPTPFSLWKVTTTMKQNGNGGDTVLLHGVASTQQMLLCEALRLVQSDTATEHKSFQSTILLSLARTLVGFDPSSRVLLHDGTQLSRLDCIVRAIKVGSRAALLDASRELGVDGTVNIDGVVRTSKDLVILALETEKAPQLRNEYAWERLAELLPDDGSTTRATLHGGQIVVVCKADCVEKAAKCRAARLRAQEQQRNTQPRPARGSKLNKATTPTGKNNISKETLVAQLAKQPMKSKLWLSLGQLLADGESVTLSNGSVVTGQDCRNKGEQLLNAPSPLSGALSGGGPVTLTNSKRLLKQAQQMSPSRTILVKGVRYSKLQLLLQAVTCAPRSAVVGPTGIDDVMFLHLASVYVELAKTLPRVNSARANLKDGSAPTHDDCLAKAVELSLGDARVLLDVSGVLGPRRTVTVGNTVMNAKDLVILGLVKHPTDPNLWVRLSELLGNDETATLKDGRTVTRMDCAVAATGLKPQRRRHRL